MSSEAVQKLVYSLFFYNLENEKETMLRILLLMIFAAFFSSFSNVFEDSMTAEISFYVIYMILFSMLMGNFSKLSKSLTDTLFWISDFMKVLSPAYFLAVAAADGAATATVFYQGVLFLVWGLQWILANILLPAVEVYILLSLVNHISREEMLSKMAELTETAIQWGLKTLLGIAAGLQIIKSMVAPVLDTIKRTMLGKTASVIPGVGGAVHVITELVITSAVLVRNSLGAAVLIVLVIVGLGPVIHYGILSFLYRFLSAVAQPVSDKRIVGCLSTMGNGCSLLLKIMLTSEILCMIIFLIILTGMGK